MASATDGWPFADNVFDNVLCTQVLEHVVDLRGALSEIGRVIKPGGTVIVTVPFIYHEHGAPFDYRRFSIYGAKQYFAKHYEITELKRQGGIGSTLGLLWLAWIELEMARWRATRFLKGACFPLWVVYCGLVNGLCYLIDRLDRTQSAYSNLLIIVRKKATETNGVITCGVSVPSTSAKTPH